ncbi:MAG: phosphoribosylformylglycinamidine cyclo-ligase, partial [Anaerolineae bacterium]
MTTYREAGVDIEAGNRAVALMRAAVQATYTPAVLAGIGAFGGLFDAAALQTMTAPVLVASTDGVGTKVKVAAQMQRFDTIGADLVNHCVNDILVQGGRPLFFLDYIAASRLAPAKVAAVVTGMADACRAVGCVLLGGETAEMPGVYQAGEFDVAGTIVGVVERSRIVDGRDVQVGDVLMGLLSNGLHTNGFSLARRVLAGLDWAAPHPELGSGRSIGDALLLVHRCYLPEVERLWAAGVVIEAMAHITGGGLLDNVPRSLPAGLGAGIEAGAWPAPPIFELIRRLGEVPDDDMFRTFNMGVGMVIVVAPDAVAA